MKERVEEVLDQIRPMLHADGGDVEVVDIQEGVVLVRLLGACMGCPAATMTLKAGIEETLKAQIPEIKRVEAVYF